MKAHARNTNLMSVATDQARHMMDMGSNAYRAAAKQTRIVGKNVDHYVHENPWTVMGAALGLGILVGWMMHRK